MLKKLSIVVDFEIDKDVSAAIPNILSEILKDGADKYKEKHEAEVFFNNLELCKVENINYVN